jgi:hypothetical protein
MNVYKIRPSSVCQEERHDFTPDPHPHLLKATTVEEKFTPQKCGQDPEKL